jgi:hypothetical protein
MTQARCLFFSTAIILLAVPGVPRGASAQTPGQGVERPTPAPQAPIAVSQDARETREQFEGILRRLPPAVGRVLRTDPSLMRNQSYLATYPTLAAFLQQHPEVANAPGYYLENVSAGFWEPARPADPRTAAINMWRDFIEGLAIGAVFTVITLGFLWLVRIALQHHRWNRTFKAQTALQNKLLDRFTSHEDLLAYINTPGGRPIADLMPQPAEAARPLFSPFSRILWSVQIGLVLSAGAIGLILVSGRVVEEVAQMFLAAGVLALALGIGFVVSAAASLLLSQRLGLLGPPAPREHSNA